MTENPGSLGVPVTREPTGQQAAKDMGHLCRGHIVRQGPSLCSDACGPGLWELASA